MENMNLLKKTLVSLIPGFTFSFATIIAINTNNFFISVCYYFIAYMSLSLYTYLLNKID